MKEVTAYKCDHCKKVMISETKMVKHELHCIKRTVGSLPQCDSVPPSKIVDNTPKFVVLDTWTESERGWGQRPDGCSIHLTMDDYKEFVKEYWARQPDGPAPDEYSRPDGSPKPLEISNDLYEKLIATKNGMALWQSELNKFRGDGTIKL